MNKSSFAASVTGIVVGLAVLVLSRQGIVMAQASTGITSIVSISSDHVQGDYWSLAPTISGDGRFVAFESRATTLVLGDTNGVEDVFVHDRLTHETVRISLGYGGIEADGQSYGPVISADSRIIAFASDATNLVPNDVNNQRDIFIHDLQAGSTTRVSASSSGTQGNAASVLPALSADGRFVAFLSLASNLVGGDTNGEPDVFVHDRQTGRTTRMSVNSDGAEGNLEAGPCAISADGRYVAFQSYANNLVDDDLNNATDIFVHDRQNRTTTLVSKDSSGVEGNGFSSWPTMSSGGRFIAFVSDAANLDAGDSNGVADAFIHDTASGQTTRIMVGEGNTYPIEFTSNPRLSADGRFVAFRYFAKNSPFDLPLFSDIYVLDRQTGETRSVSLGLGGVPANGDSAAPVISAGGHFVAFTSWASNLVAIDVNNSADVFVHEQSVTVPLPPMIADITPMTGSYGTAVRITGENFTGNASVTFGGVPAIVISDGLPGTELTAFVPAGASTGKILITTDGGAAESAGEFTVLPPPLPVIAGFTPQSGAAFERITITGTALEYASEVTFNGVPAPMFNAISDTEVSALVPPGATTGPIVIETPSGQAASSTDFEVMPCSNPCRIVVGYDGLLANGPSSEPAVSSDGRYILFNSEASNLVPGDDDNSPNAFYIDSQTGVITRLGEGLTIRRSISANGQYMCYTTLEGDRIHDRTAGIDFNLSEAVGTSSEMYGCALSGDGRYIAFFSADSGLVAGDTNGTTDVFVYDRQEDVVRRVSVGSSGEEANAYSLRHAISVDGRFVAFVSRASNLSEGDINDRQDAFVHDVETGITSLISTKLDNEIFRETDNLSISADGRFVAYEAFRFFGYDATQRDRRDIFVYDRLTGETTQISNTVRNAVYEGYAEPFSASPYISPDGRFVAFLSMDILVPEDTNGTVDVYIYDRANDSYKRFPTIEGQGEGFISMTADSQYFILSAVGIDAPAEAVAPWPASPTHQSSPGSSATALTESGSQVSDIVVYRRPLNPAITDISPRSATPGSIVTVTGLDFIDVNRVLFNGVEAPSFTVSQYNQIQVIVPADARTGKVVVVTPDGTARSARPFIVKR